MKIETVLCPVDLSRLDDRELDLAVQVCEAFDARLVVHHNLSTVSPGLSKAWEWDQEHRLDDAEAQRRVEELLKGLSSSVRATAVVTHGPVALVLLALAEKLPADLVVLGTHGRSTEDHASVTERLIEGSPCPVLVIRDVEAAGPYRLRPEAGEEIPVVVPTDFSPSAERAVAYAFALAHALPLRLHLLHVAPTEDPVILEGMANSIPPQLTGRAECHVRTGRADEEIEKFVRETDPRLVIMGTHARDFWRRLFTRDTARRFLHDASCPVCFVPPTAAV